jgi:hypothetical protein
MERRQAHSFFRSRLRRATTLSRGDRDLSRRSTVAVFGCGPTKPAPGSGTGAAATARATPKGLAVGVRTSRRCGSRRSVGRHSPLRLLCAHLIVIWRYCRQVRFPSTLTYTLLLLQPLRKPHAIRRCWVPPGVAQERTHFPGRLHSGCTPVADSGGRSGTPPDFIEN